MKAGDIIKQKRIDLGLTQSQLGDLAGFSQQAIAKFESGERTIDENKIYVFAKVLQQEALQLPESEWEPVCYETNDNIRGKKIFALGVKGNSMNRIFPPERTTLICLDINDYYDINAEGIQNGDYVIAQRISIDGRYEATVKRYTRIDPSTVILSPESTDDSFQPIVLSANDNNGYEIKAVVIDYQMKLKKL